ncbi:MAG: hypothetical protein P4L86_17600, partial [Mycobacterium sp.]|nr:hypothetical protein [Mycobacterium sp.]
ANAFVGAITGSTTTATGTLQAAIVSGVAQTVSVNVTSTCPFVLGPNGLNTTVNFSDISDARSITVGGMSGNIESVNFGAGLYGHAVGSTVTQTVQSCSAFASPGTVGAVVTQGGALQKATQQQVNPGQQNQLAGTTTITEPSAGFLAAASTLTFKISAAGVLFSNPPTASVPVVTALGKPTGLTATAANVAGTLPAATYSYEVTALGVTSAGTGVGETVASSVATATLASTGSIALTWSAVPGATGYKLYRLNGTYKLLATTTTATSFTDLGTVVLGAAPVSGGAFLAAPTGFVGALSATGGTLTAGTRYYAVAAINGAGQTVGSAPALVTISSGATNSVALNWNPVAGATGYAVFEADTLAHLNTATTPQYW